MQSRERARTTEAEAGKLVELRLLLEHTKTAFIQNSLDHFISFLGLQIQ